MAAAIYDILLQSGFRAENTSEIIAIKKQIAKCDSESVLPSQTFLYGFCVKGVSANNVFYFSERF
jgi:hypothetical protein